MNSSRPPELIWTFNQSKKNKTRSNSKFDFGAFDLPQTYFRVHLDKNLQSKRTKTSPSLIKNLTSEQKMFFPKPEHMRRTQPGKLQQGRIWGCKEKQNTSADFRNISPFLKQNWRTEFISPLCLFPLTTALRLIDIHMSHQLGVPV